MKQVTIPAQWLQELIALCGPEDHELRERVMKSAAPAPVDALATGGQAQARSKSGWTFEELEAQLAEATKADPENCRAVGEELLKVIHDNFTALKAAGWDGPVDSPVEVVAGLLNLLDEANAAAPQAQADARDADTFEQRMSDWQHGDALDAERYRWLRSRDLETISQGGVFAGMTPQNVILNEEDLDQAVDAAIAAAKGEQQ